MPDIRMLLDTWFEDNDENAEKAPRSRSKPSSLPEAPTRPPKLKTSHRSRQDFSMGYHVDVRTGERIPPRRADRNFSILGFDPDRIQQNRDWDVRPRFTQEESPAGAIYCLQFVIPIITMGPRYEPRYMRDHGRRVGYRIAHWMNWLVGEGRDTRLSSGIRMDVEIDPCSYSWLVTFVSTEHYQYLQPNWPGQVIDRYVVSPENWEYLLNLELDHFLT